MAFDAHLNFAYSTVSVAPVPAASGLALTVATGDGALFPTAPFNASVWPTASLPLKTNAEIVRVTNIVGDVLTITRTQESTSARTIVAGDQIAATITAKVITDIESAIQINVSAGTTSNNLTALTFSNGSGVSFGLASSVLTASVNTVGTATTVKSIATANSVGTVTRWAAEDHAHALPFISSYENCVPFASNIAVTLNGVSISHAVAFNMPQPISMSFIRLAVVMTTGSTTAATTGSSMSASGAYYSTWNAVIYSLGTGASSKSLLSVTSGSGGVTGMNSISIAANGTQYSISQTYSLSALVEGGNSSRSTQYSISNTNYSITTNQIFTEWSGSRFLDIACAATLSQGNYWLVFGYSSSAATNSTGATFLTKCSNAYSAHYAASQANINFGIMGSTNMTSGGLLGAGSFSTAGGGTTSGFPISAISSSASNIRHYFQMLRSV